MWIKQVWLAFAVLLFSTTICRSEMAFDYEKDATTTSLEHFDVATWLRAEAYGPLEKKLALLAKDTSRDEFNRRLIWTTYEINDSDPALDGKTNRWCELYPKSYFALAFRGAYLNAYAWRARGAGWGYSVKPIESKRFHDRLIKSQQVLQQAIQLNPQDPFAPMLLIMLSYGLGLPAAQEAGYLKAAIAADPNYYFAYIQHLNYLMPKWRGSMQLMLDFARQCAANPPDHSRIHFILLDAHWELAADYNEGSAHWNAPGVWEDVDRVFQTELKWRNTPKAHNEYAYYANICGQSAVLKRELEIIGYDMRRDVWKAVDPWIYARATVFPEYQGTRGKAGQYRWLIDQMNTVIPKAPNGGPYYMRGVAYRFFKDYAAAEIDLKAALERSPYHTACLMELAQLYEKDLNQPRQAAAYYLRLQQADPMNNSIYVPLIDFLTEQQQTTDCLRVSRDYFRLHPEYAQSRVYCAGAEARAKNFDRALAILNEAIYIPATQLEGQSNLTAELETQACLYATRGYVYYLAGNYVNALRDSKVAAAGVQDFMQGNYVMMRIYLGIGGPALMNPSEALKCAVIRRTQLVHPDGDDYYWLGLAYAINNQTADARELYESGLKATPGHTSCTLGLQALKLPPVQLAHGEKPAPSQAQ